MWVCFLYLTIMPGNIVRILPPSATSFQSLTFNAKTTKTLEIKAMIPDLAWGEISIGGSHGGSGVMHRESPGSFKISQ